jgi:hypothetical protein
MHEEDDLVVTMSGAVLCIHELAASAGLERLSGSPSDLSPSGAE